MAVEHRMPALTPRKSRQRRHHDRPALGEFVEKRHPFRQPAKPGEEPELGPGARGPDAAREAIDFDGRGFRFRHRLFRRRRLQPEQIPTVPPVPSGSIGSGHQRSSHSACTCRSFGSTFSANSRVLYLASSLFMLPNCKSVIRCPTLRLVATSVSCSTTSSGEPMIRHSVSLSTMASISRASAANFVS